LYGLYTPAACATQRRHRLPLLLLVILEIDLRPTIKHFDRYKPISYQEDENIILRYIQPRDQIICSE